MPLRISTLLVCCLVASVTGCASSEPKDETKITLREQIAGRKDFPGRMGETWRHLRDPKSGEWSIMFHHLKRVDSLESAVALYAETGRTERGFGAIASDLFGSFLGPWSTEGLEDYLTHLHY